MPKLIRRHHKYLLLAFLILYFLAGRPPQFGEENLFFQGFPIAKPVIRIALGINLDDVQIRSSSGMKVYQVDGSYRLLAENVAETTLRGYRESLSEKFLVQTGQFRKRNEADAAAKFVRGKTARRVTVSQESEGGAEGLYQVRVGDFLTRGEALAFIKTIRGLGVKEAWIVREDVVPAENHPQWVILGGQLINLNSAAALYFVPTSTESYLSFRSRDYRGIFILRGSRKGLILINILNVEDYLKGVVPGELPPSYFNEIEAQKAQAIAARTYALKNTGQFNDLGFDLFATPVSQVYLGLSAEAALSTKAVEETGGQVAVFDGKLINALYMSTCGGATENVEAMFEGVPMPYLKSTECVLDGEKAWPLKTPAVFPAIAVDGLNAASRIAALTGLGIVPLETDAGWWKEPVSGAEAWDWTAKAAALLGKKPAKTGVDAAGLNFPALAVLLVAAFDWNDRVANLMLPGEADRSLPAAAASLPPGERAAVAYFVVSGLVPPTERIADRSRNPTRAEAAIALFKVLFSYKDFYHQGSIHALDGAMATLHEDGNDRNLEIVPGVALFREYEGAAAAVSGLDLYAGDGVRWIEAEGKIKLLQVVSAPPTAVLDATAQFHHWQVRSSRQELQERINLFYPIGRLIDLQLLKRGESKRVVEMAVVGSEGRTVLRGLKIRQVLNLRDNLFTVDREFAADGGVSNFVFSGKGWGHGVGLCQIGAFRMAQKGAAYEDILKKYYRGISLKRIY